jgi:DNA-binding beta-propeller fold protein YncE
VEFTRDGDMNWTESKRWSAWGERPEEKFGEKVTVSADSGKLWVSDTTRHRVLCFDAVSHKLLGSFGTADTAGDDMESVNSPQTLVARGDRAVVFDSGNQRLLKFELKK